MEESPIPARRFYNLTVKKVSEHDTGQMVHIINEQPDAVEEERQAAAVEEAFYEALAKYPRMKNSRNIAAIRKFHRRIVRV